MARTSGIRIKHKPQLRHVQKTAPRPYDPMIGRDKSKVVNDEIVEFRKADDQWMLLTGPMRSLSA